MSQKQYRRLTRFLFLLLFALFFLLYLLLRGQSGGIPRQNGGGLNWVERHLTLGDITVSEVRSSGFLVNQFPLPASTRVSDEDFEENVITVTTSVYNEGAVAVDITPSVYGTKKAESADTNPGLHCGFYHYGGEINPAEGGYAAFLSGYGWTDTPHGDRALSLHVKGSAPFTLEPGERRQIVLFFWADADEIPTLTDLVRGDYSVTVKLTSRASP